MGWQSSPLGLSTMEAHAEVFDPKARNMKSNGKGYSLWMSMKVRLKVHKSLRHQGEYKMAKCSPLVRALGRGKQKWLNLGSTKKCIPLRPLLNINHNKIACYARWVTSTQVNISMPISTMGCAMVDLYHGSHRHGHPTLSWSIPFVVAMVNLCGDHGSCHGCRYHGTLGQWCHGCQCVVGHWVNIGMDCIMVLGPLNSIMDHWINAIISHWFWRFVV